MPVCNYVTALQYEHTSATASGIQVQGGDALPTPPGGTEARALNVRMTTTGTNTFMNLQGYQSA